MEGPGPFVPSSAPSTARAARLLGTGMVVVALVGLVSSCERAGTHPPVAPSSVTCAEPPTPPTAAPTFTAAPDPSVAGAAFWEVTLHTTCGEVRLLLDGGRAPRSVASFVTLARAGYWDDSVCHRLTTKPAPTAFLQCGDATGHSTADPGYDLPLENVPADRTYRVGDVGVARGDGFPSTSGEFFVVHENFTVPTEGVLYSVVGRVLSGQDVVQHIVARGGEDFRSDGPPFESISVLGVDVRRR